MSAGRDESLPGGPARDDVTSLASCFVEAAGGRIIDHAFEIAGLKLKLRLAGPALEPVLLPALAHLATGDGGEAGLEVLAWDSASTGVELPPPPPAGVESPEVQRVYQYGVEILTVIDHARRRAILWVPDARGVPSNEAASPLRVILHLWLSRRGFQVVHGAAVGRRDGGVLIAGRAGAGKSTTALSCLDSELLFASDDYVLLRDDPAPHVYSLFSSAKLEPHQLERFPALRPLVANVGAAGEKPVIFLHPRHADRLATGFPVRAVLAPRVVGHGPTRVVPVRPAAVLTALAPSTIFQLPFSGRETLRTLARCLEQVPCFELALGERIEEIPATILELLARLAEKP